MNQRAQKDLLDVIMLDDFVARREALLKWTARWIDTLQCTAEIETSRRRVQRSQQGPESHERMEQAAMLDQLLVGLLSSPVKVTHIKVTEGVPDTKIVTSIHVVLQEPRE